MPEISNSISPKIFYRKMGAGPVVFLLHGFPESGSLWRKIWDELALSFTVIIPDLPGSGNSILEHETSIVQLAECVKDIMDAELIDRAVIAGHSMGGYIGFAFAALYPERLQGLSLIHSNPLADDEEKKVTRRKTIELIKKGATKLFITQMVPNLFSDQYKQLHPQDVEDQIELALAIEDNGLINFQNAMIGREDRADILKNADFPLQWVIGEGDNVINYKKILEFCYRSPINFVTFNRNCGHMSMIEVPEQLTVDLKAFINYCYAHRPI